jgi:hypothetical protein
MICVEILLKKPKVIGLEQAQQLQLVVDLPIDQWKNRVSPLSESCSGV